MKIKEKLKKAGYTEDSIVYRTVLDIEFILGNKAISPEERSEIISIFTSRFRNDLETVSTYSEEDWRDYDYGNVSINEYVRVKKDAYDSSSGKAHNGKVGRLVKSDGKRVTVKYLATGRSKTHTHPENMLECLKWDVK